MFDFPALLPIPAGYRTHILHLGEPTRYEEKHREVGYFVRSPLTEASYKRVRWTNSASFRRAFRPDRIPMQELVGVAMDARVHFTKAVFFMTLRKSDYVSRAADMVVV